VIGESGLVLTADHVVYEMDRIAGRVGGSGPRYRAALIGANMSEDVALVRLVGASGLRPALLADPFAARPGDPVVVMGNAEGRGIRAVRASVAETYSAGRVSSGNGWPGSIAGALELSGRVIEGQSGGPVADRTGRVIGMLVAGGGTDAFAVDSSNLTFAAMRIAAGRPDNETTIGLQPTLGIEVEDAGDDRGARVTAVLSGTPASCMGIGPGNVIVGVDDTSITSGREFSLVLVRYRTGDRIRLDWTTRLTRHSSTVRLAAGSGP
jgi:S1-C subfamily serine protease